MPLKFPVPKEVLNQGPVLKDPRVEQMLRVLPEGQSYMAEVVESMDRYAAIHLLAGMTNDGGCRRLNKK